MLYYLQKLRFNLKLKDKTKCVIFTLLVGAFFLTTGWERCQLNLLQVGTERLMPFSKEERRVNVIAKAMSPEESKQYFGHDFISRGIQPIEFTIQNNSSLEYSLCPSSIDLPQLPPSKVAFQVTKSAIPRGIAYRIASFLFWPFLIPSTIDSIRVMSHHQQLKKEIKGVGVKQEVLASYSTFHRILFVPKEEIESSFTVTLIELESLEPIEFFLVLNRPLA